MNIDRRGFISLCTSLCTLVTTTGCTAGTWYRARPDSDGSFQVPKSLFVDSGFVMVERSTSAFPVAVVKRSEDEFVAIVTECTHRGCAVDVRASGMVCPCHGSEFTLDGQVTHGPAQRDLARLPISTSPEHVTVLPASASA